MFFHPFPHKYKFYRIFLALLIRSVSVILASQENSALLFISPKIEVNEGEKLMLSYIIDYTLKYNDKKSVIQNVKDNFEKNLFQGDISNHGIVLLEAQPNEYIYSCIRKEAIKHNINMLEYDIICNRHIKNEYTYDVANYKSMESDMLKDKSFFYLKKRYTISKGPISAMTVQLTTASGQELGAFNFDIVRKEHHAIDLLFEALCMYEGKVLESRLKNVSVYSKNGDYANCTIEELENLDVKAYEYVFTVGDIVDRATKNDIANGSNNDANRKNGSKKREKKEHSRTERAIFFIGGSLVIGGILYFFVTPFNKFVNSLVKRKRGSRRRVGNQ